MDIYFNYHVTSQATVERNLAVEKIIIIRSLMPQKSLKLGVILRMKTPHFKGI